MIEEDIIEVLEEHGVRFEERAEVLSMLRYSIEKGWIKFFIEDGKRLGFVTWILEEHKDGNFLFVTNIILEGKDFIKILKLRKFFKDNYGPIKKVQWNNNRKNLSVVRTPLEN